MTTYQDRKTNSIVRFLEEVSAGKFVFDFYWPLEVIFVHKLSIQPFLIRTSFHRFHDQYSIFVRYPCEFPKTTPPNLILKLKLLHLFYLLCKDWPGKKVTILQSRFLMVKSSELFESFYLHINWLCGSCNHQRFFENYSFWRCDSWFSFRGVKLNSVKYSWNHAFSGIKRMIYTNIALF